ncbi:Uncharacterised protein [Salmonella enterica subsp. enterica]|uniref:Uncharacterized protein n=1 Tax=Salmonella enterica I TaxID=59201 RepID=A0A447PP54_SALET|nr:Uncharacterised protein [Salmonella enterica subsp. enterica]
MHLIFIIDINGLAKFITFVTLIADQSGGLQENEKPIKKGDGVPDSAVLISPVG